MNIETTDKIRRCFENMAVYKNLKQNNIFSTLGLPSFMRDWLLQRFEDENGEFSVDEMKEFIDANIPRHDDWTRVKDRIVNNYERVKMLAKVIVDINIATGTISFSMPDFGLKNKETMIESDVWERCRNELVSGKETWGKVELGYRLPDENSKPKKPGKFRLLSFENFCPYEIDAEFFKDVRNEFSIAEWIDIVLGAIDYNADGYEIAKNNNSSLPEVETMKMAMLTRLLPFVEKRLNLIELAPMGTGKSYVFGQISRYGWLSTSDKMTRAKLFYDLSKREEGLMAQNDFVVLDEIQKTVFEESIGSTMQGYLEQGRFTVGNYSGAGYAGIILCGNISPDLMKADGYEYMFGKLPSIFHDAAMIDRFHGFIKGWHIPRMNDDLKVCGWALNSEYFTAILHELRDDISYRAVVDELVEVPNGADTRDTEAVKRIATAYLKLLFPNVQHATDISYADFSRYCFRPALQMRYTIKYQMGLMNEQYRGKDIPSFKVHRYA